MPRTTKPWSDAEKQFITEYFEQREGVLYWKRNRRDRKAGDKVRVTLNKTPTGSEYYRYGAVVNGKLKVFLVHHIVFFLSRGYQCLSLVDHKNHDTKDNHPDNLREATPSENMANRKGHTVKLSLYSVPYKGVMRTHAKSERYQAALCGKCLGSFPTAEEAARAYDKAALSKYGEFAYLNFPQL